MAGYVFLLQGDLTALACDAWLVSGGRGEPGEAWRAVLGDAVGAEAPVDGVRRWPPAKPGDPTPYVVDVFQPPGTPIEDYVKVVQAFFSRVAQDLSGTPPKNRRAKHLVALPLVGTGRGGLRRQSGAVAQALLPALYEAADRHDLDVALVMIEGASYSAAQAERLGAWGARVFGALGPGFAETAQRLTSVARKGELVLFLGAGISMAAGLPAWGGLLERLAKEQAGLTDAELEDLRRLSLMDQAHVIEERLATIAPSISLGRSVAQMVQATHYALSHGLLATLPVEAVVTTNYDTLFERASRAAGREVSVLPYEPVEHRRWLLKMHGCVEHPEDIVLTRAHYLAYRERREALAGIVQALLITRHMLFLGFSLEDDNFHQIIRAVRRAKSPAGTAPDRASPFGTSLVVGPNPLAEELWKRDLHWVSLSDDPKEVARAARALEILLDQVAAGATSATEHLFEERYDPVLSAGEREVKARLTQLMGEASADAKRTPAWAEVERMMQRLGWRRS